MADSYLTLAADYRPFTLAELRARLELAGLREVDTDFDDTRDQYCLITAAS